MKRKSVSRYVKRRHVCLLPRNPNAPPWFFEMICEALFSALCFVSGRQWVSHTMSSPARIKISQCARHTFCRGLSLGLSVEPVIV